MSRKLLIMILMLSLTVMLAVAGCNSTTSQPIESEPTDSEPVVSEKPETTFERAKREGYVTVGFANEAPYAFATPDGKLTGYNVEVARAILKNMGIEEMNGVLTEFGSLIPGLNAKRFDIITAGMYITTDRSKQVSFANPEYTIGAAIAVKAGNPLNISSYEDIAANSNVKAAVMGGAIEYDQLIAVGVAESQISIVPDQPSALAALQAGRVDVITMTGPALQSMLDAVNDAKIERVFDFTQPVIDGKSPQGYGAAAFRMDNNDFREAYNQELENLKQSGELLEILEAFGFTEQEFPGDATVAEALLSW